MSREIILVSNATTFRWDRQLRQCFVYMWYRAIVSEVLFALKFIVHDTCLDLMNMTKTFYLLRCNTLLKIFSLDCSWSFETWPAQAAPKWFKYWIFSTVSCSMLKLYFFAGLSIPFLDFSHHFDEKRRKLVQKPVQKRKKH